MVIMYLKSKLQKKSIFIIIQKMFFFSDEQVYKHILGIVPLDLINSKLPLLYNTFVIINLRKSFEAHLIGHWIVLHRNSDGCYEMFNSLGWKEAEKRNVLTIINIDSRDIAFNSKQCQSDSSVGVI